MSELSALESANICSWRPRAMGPFAHPLSHAALLAPQVPARPPTRPPAFPPACPPARLPAEGSIHNVFWCHHCQRPHKQHAWHASANLR